MRKLGLAGVLVLITCVHVSSVAWAQQNLQNAQNVLNFRRGDCDGNGFVGGTVNDMVFYLNWAFSGGTPPGCLAACDTDGDGFVGGSVNDAVYYANWAFLGGQAPPAPFPDCGPDPEATLSCLVYETDDCPQGPPPTTPRTVGHVLNRIAYGPSAADIQHVQEVGIQAYIEEQLDPASIDESTNDALNTRVEALFEELFPVLISVGELWRYSKGTSEPPAGWKEFGFDDSTWTLGPSGFGYGDRDDETVLGDMRGNYFSVYLRKSFSAPNRADVERLLLQVDYDDGFVAYLNGNEVARRNVQGSPPPYNADAEPNREAGEAEIIDITAQKDSLNDGGANVLAIQVHNGTLGSSDLSMIPELLYRRTGTEPVRVIGGVEQLQELVHIRGVYSRKQLQAVLAEFWENHFTTDANKVAEYFDNQKNFDATDAMGAAQAMREAANVELLEYQFFYDNALGNFGDLLLYSASSPSMLIYLDNVLNSKVQPNENYSREIKELSAFGVDNRYTQRDVRELAKCFTGWTVCKVAANEAQSFPDSALNPPNICGVFTDSPILEGGSSGMGLAGSWRYFKGTEEPSPVDVRGELLPSIEWAQPNFDDSQWLSGTTEANEGVGFELGDDDVLLTASIDLSDMRGNYLTVYLRKTFTITEATLENTENLLLEVEYDDGYVAYLNGFPVAQSVSMDDELNEGPLYSDTGEPFSFDERAEVSHERTLGPDYTNLNLYREVIDTNGPNILAIELHNQNVTSRDLNVHARFIDRHVQSGVDAGDPTGQWTFRFDPDDHDTSDKTLFLNEEEERTELTLDVPGRSGPAGVDEAVEVIAYMANHISTREFICLKLLQKFIHDEFSLARFKAGLLTTEQNDFLTQCMDTWLATGGNIEAVMRVILDPENQSNYFWSEEAYRAKVKTPVEYVNSSMRILDALQDDIVLREENQAMGMQLFTRAAPDGWSEVGLDWMDTGSMLARIDFVQDLSLNRKSGGGGALRYSWDPQAFFGDPDLDTPQEIVDHVSTLFFDATLKQETKDLLIEFLGTDDDYQSLSFDREGADFQERIQDFMGLVLALPHWHFQ